MRLGLAQMLVSMFDKNVTLTIPTFKICLTQPFLGPGRLYLNSTAHPTFFLFLQLSEKRDAFTIELAWSVDGIFPQSEGYRIPRNWPELAVNRTDINADRFRFRLSKLWVKPKYDPWWEFSPHIGVSKASDFSIRASAELDDCGKCEQLVSDAMQKILEFGVPYMTEIQSRQFAHD